MIVKGPHPNHEKDTIILCLVRTKSWWYDSRAGLVDGCAAATAPRPGQEARLHATRNAVHSTYVPAKGRTKDACRQYVQAGARANVGMVPKRAGGHPVGQMAARTRVRAGQATQATTYAAHAGRPRAATRTSCRLWHTCPSSRYAHRATCGLRDSPATSWAS